MKEINCGSYQKIADLKELMVLRTDAMEKLTEERFKSHLQRFEGSDKAISAALAAAKEAVQKAETATEKRFDSVNEFRSTLADQQRTLMPRVEAELLVKGLNDRLKIIEDARIEKAGEGGGAKNLWANIVGVIGVVSLIITFLMKIIKP